MGTLGGLQIPTPGLPETPARAQKKANVTWTGGTWILQIPDPKKMENENNNNNY
jgi:hypothetical protein